MKQKLKNVAKKLPIGKQIYNKFSQLQQERDALEREVHLQADAKIDLRLQLKQERGEPIHVVFVCHRPSVWESLHSVYNYMKVSPAFRVSIVAIPSKNSLPGLGLNHQVYESEGAETFWAEENCIQGFDYETKQWLDLETLEPDYIFFQQPYNVCRPPHYHSKMVSRYARICYVSYFGSYHTDAIYDECKPLDYLQDLSFFFTQNPRDHAHIQKRFTLVEPHCCRIVNTGFPRYDLVEGYKEQKSGVWKNPDTFKILWTPRWTTNEGNCHFFDYKDLIVDYCKDNPVIELVFRPHPQAFKEWNATGEFPEKDAEAYKQNFVNSNLHIDMSSNYFPTLFESDCLITDKSSMLLDYYCTGKPIIYCTNAPDEETLFPELMSGMYCATSWDDVCRVLTDLRNGVDPLQEKRDEVMQSFIYSEEPAGRKIVKAILENK